MNHIYLSQKLSYGGRIEFKKLQGFVDHVYWVSIVSLNHLNPGLLALQSLNDHTALCELQK